jgi:acetyltransferase-like isoleucine patch superfamily enzyme
MQIFNKVHLFFSTLFREVLILLPDDFSRFRVEYYNKRGSNISRASTISPNVRIRGRFEMQSGSSVAQNCTISGGSVGIFIGKNVMIAPNVVLVAFDHGFKDTDIPMVRQNNVEAAIVIEDDVWIAANCTIAKGVRVGSGAIVGANSCVTQDVPSLSIVGGVPAKLIGRRGPID